MFTQNCVLRDAPKNLWENLANLGYQMIPPLGVHATSCRHLVCWEGTWRYSADERPLYGYECDDIEEFLAIAAMRDDSDANQWFICEYEDERFPAEYSMFFCTDDDVADFVRDKMGRWDVGIYHRATPREIFRYLKKRKEPRRRYSKAEQRLRNVLGTIVVATVLLIIPLSLSIYVGYLAETEPPRTITRNMGHEARIGKTIVIDGQALRIMNHNFWAATYTLSNGVALDDDYVDSRITAYETVPVEEASGLETGILTFLGYYMILAVVFSSVGKK